MADLILPPRLKCIASFVPEGASLTDVGTDHGWLPIYLLNHHFIRSAVATDIRRGPLERAITHAQEYHAEHLKCVLSDGLCGVRPEEAECIVIAGMGGENIAGILARASWLQNSKTIILQPMSHPEELRRAFAELKIKTDSEVFVVDSGRLYSVLVCSPGAAYPYSEIELFTGRKDQVINQPLFRRRAAELHKLFFTIMEGSAHSENPEMIAQSNYYKKLLQELDLLLTDEDPRSAEASTLI